MLVLMRMKCQWNLQHNIYFLKGFVPPSYPYLDVYVFIHQPYASDSDSPRFAVKEPELGEADC
jgi:hypothetical protein